MTLTPIATIDTPYDEKFAVPRQPGLVQCESIIRFTEPELSGDALRGLEAFSHVWLIFGFHHNQKRGWKSLVRPPRLGGNTKMGVLATRSSHRPNGLGLSVVQIGRIHADETPPQLTVMGADLVNGTPIYDIKPYLPYADRIESATGGFASTPPAPLPVAFEARAEQQLSTTPSALKPLIIDVLSQDPRPAYHNDDNQRRYGVSLMGFNVRFYANQRTLWVSDICACDSGS